MDGTNVNLEKKVTDENGNVLYTITTTLLGDGSTPMVQTMLGTKVPVGYADDGMPIYKEFDEAEILKNEQDFMASAILLQKTLSAQNGIDPSVVNMIGAEKK